MKIFLNLVNSKFEFWFNAVRYARNGCHIFSLYELETKTTFFFFFSWDRTARRSKKQKTKKDSTNTATMRYSLIRVEIKFTTTTTTAGTLFTPGKHCHKTGIFIAQIMFVTHAAVKT